jgi:hypothetical protein
MSRLPSGHSEAFTNVHAATFGDMAQCGSGAKFDGAGLPLQHACRPARLIDRCARTAGTGRR